MRLLRTARAPHATRQNQSCKTLFTSSSPSAIYAQANYLCTFPVLVYRYVKRPERQRNATCEPKLLTSATRGYHQLVESRATEPYAVVPMPISSERTDAGSYASIYRRKTEQLL